jgi:uncharacterized protein (DUF305 family)
MNTTTLTAVVAVLIGFVIGWFAHTAPYGMEGAHVMPDNSKMANEKTMGDMMHSMSAALAGKTGDAFDKAFLEEMIVHHEGAVTMAEQVLATSKRPELIKLANDIIGAQTKEIAMMKGWLSSWFK